MFCYNREGTYWTKNGNWKLKNEVKTKSKDPLTKSRKPDFTSNTLK